MTANQFSSKNIKVNASEYVGNKDDLLYQDNIIRVYDGLTAGGRIIAGPGLVSNVIVNEASDLAGNLDASKVYIIDGSIDMGTTQIIVPPGGLNILGLGFGISQLTTEAANTTLFIDDGNYSGNLFLNNVEIEVSGAGSNVFDLDNNGNFAAFECEQVNFIECLSLGRMANYRQMLWSNLALISCIDGLELIGNWTGAAILTSIIVGSTFTGTLFKAGTALSITGSFRSDMNALSLNTAGAFCDFSPANIINDGQFTMEGVRVNSASNAFPNMPSSDVKVRFSNCTGVENTYPGAVVTVTTAAATNIITLDVLAPMSGIGTISEMNWMSRFDDNSLIYESDVTIDVSVSGSFSFTGTANNEMAIQLRHWNNSLGSYVNIGPEYRATLNGGPPGTHAENLTFGAYATLSNNDRIEIWIKNLTSNNDITTSVGGEMRVAARAS